MRLDRFIPAYDFSETDAISVQATPERIWLAIRKVTLRELPVFRILLGLRSLPARLAGGCGLRFAHNETLIEWARKNGFLLLDEVPHRELVFGIIGQPWKFSGGQLAKISDAQDFLAFRRPGYVKVAANFYIERILGQGSWRLTTETRICAPDSSARKKFFLYWLFVRPGSGLIRREWLSAIKRRAEYLQS